MSGGTSVDITESDDDVCFVAARVSELYDSESDPAYVDNINVEVVSVDYGQGVDGSDFEEECKFVGVHEGCEIS